MFHIQRHPAQRDMVQAESQLDQVINTSVATNQNFVDRQQRIGLAGGVAISDLEAAENDLVGGNTTR